MFWRRRSKVYRTKPIRGNLIGELNKSQAGINGFDLNIYQRSHVVLVGAGGIGSHVAQALVRKGIGKLTLLDDDRVELKNCTRQLFGRDDVGCYKSRALAQRLAAEGLFKTEIVAVPKRFQEAIEDGMTFTDCVLVGGVDNNPSRKAVAQYADQHDLPAILAAVSGDGGRLYVMAQRPGEACWGCAFPHYVDDRSYPCNVPGIIDVLQVTAGTIVYAIDTALCQRHTEWNVREICLDGSMPDRARTAIPRSDCTVCNRGRWHEQRSSAVAEVVL